MRHTLAFALLAAALLVPLASAQTFEAASLRPLAPGAKPNVSAAFQAFDPSRPADDLAPALLLADFTVFDMIVCAFNVRDSGLHPALEKQLPDWAQADEFHLSARLPQGATVGQMRVMLQNLLRERFALATHEEERPSPVFLLMSDSTMPLKLMPHTEPCSKDFPCGTQTSGANGALQVKLTGQTVDEIAAELGGYLWYWAGIHYGPVVNATSLQGRYDGTFTFTPIFKSDPQTVTPLPDALKHDLGLTLQKATRPVPQRVIDHLERPVLD